MPRWQKDWLKRGRQAVVGKLLQKLQQLKGLSNFRKDGPIHIEALLHSFTLENPITIEKLWPRLRTVQNGLLSVGLKLHCSNKSAELAEYLFRAESERPFRLVRAEECIVLPPMGNADVAIAFLELMEQGSGIPIFNNPDVQIQVCTPGRLPDRYASLLGVAFYLGSDVLKRFAPEDNRTSQNNYTGDRFVIYDGHGFLDRGFPWWGIEGGALRVHEQLPFLTNSRTDILSCKTRLDIKNVNLVASLLVHANMMGYWGTVGLQFASDMTDMLNRHHLGGIFATEWIHNQSRSISDNAEFYERLTELMDYAFDEVARLNRIKEEGKNIGNLQEGGILFEMQAILNKYRKLIQNHQPEAES